MSTSTSGPTEAPSGVVDVLRDAVGAVRSNPLIVAPFVVLALVTLVSQTLANFLAIAVQALAVAGAYSAIGGEVDANNSMPVRVLIAFVASLIAGIVVIVGLIALVLPGIYAMLRFRLVIAAVVLDDAGPVEALGRSIDLTSGNVTTVFGVWGLTLLASILIGGSLVAATGGLPAGNDLQAFRSTLQLATAVETLLIAPVGVAANAVMFDAFEG